MKNISFLGRWGFAYTYDAKERILFMHGGFSATHNHGQTILFQINSISKCPVPVLGLIHLLVYSSFIQLLISLWEVSKIHIFFSKIRPIQNRQDFLTRQHITLLVNFFLPETFILSRSSLVDAKLDALFALRLLYTAGLITTPGCKPLDQHS